MGFRDASKEFGSERAATGADCRIVAAGEKSVSEASNRAKKSPASDGGRYKNKKSVRLALFALTVYKSYLSVLFAGSCRFEPTCSRYAYEAIERFGVLRGMWLGTKRLLRCHPLSRKFGFDPVPEKWEEMHTNAASCAETHEVRL